MPKTPIITIDTFSSGMVQDVSTGKGFSTLFCCDIHRTPGRITAQARLDADDDTIFQTNTEIPYWFEIYDANGGTIELYAYSDEGGIYRRTAGAWAFLRDIAAADGQGFKHFQTSLYYSTRAGIGRLLGDPTVGGNYTDAYQAFTTAVSGTDFASMTIFANSLYVANTRYISKLASDQVTWTAAALTLPVGYICAAITEWNDRLVVSTQSGTSVGDEIIVFWDGVSEFPELIVHVPKPGASALFNYNNSLKAFIGNKIYAFNGADFIVEKVISKKGFPDELRNPSVYPSAVELYEERMLFGITHIMVQNDTQFLAGTYSLGKNSVDYPTALAYEFEPSTGNSGQIEIGAIKVFSSINDTPILYVAYRDIDAGLYVIDRSNVNLNQYTSVAYILTPAFELPGNYGMLVEGVRIEFDGNMITNANSNRITVRYRIDNDIDYDNDTLNFTLLGTIDNDATGSNNQNRVLSGVYRRAKRIQFKFELTTDSGTVNNNVVITKIHIY